MRLLLAKKLLQSLLVVALLPLVCLADSQQAFSIAISKQGSMPYSWFDRCSNEITGSSQHLLKKIFSSLDKQLEVQPKTITSLASIKEIVKEAEEGKVDFIFGVGGGDLSYLGLTANTVPAVIFERGLIYSKKMGVADSLDDFSGKKGI